MNTVMVTVSGPTGSCKSAICSEIEIALRAIGVAASWVDGSEERNMIDAISLDPGQLANLCVEIREVNIARIPEGYFPPDDLANSREPN
jgi:hypothetical protein